MIREGSRASRAQSSDVFRQAAPPLRHRVHSVAQPIPETVKRKQTISVYSSKSSSHYNYLHIDKKTLYFDSLNRNQSLNRLRTPPNSKSSSLRFLFTQQCCSTRIQRPYVFPFIEAKIFSNKLQSLSLLALRTSTSPPTDLPCRGFKAL